MEAVKILEWQKPRPIAIPVLHCSYIYKGSLQLIKDLFLYVQEFFPMNWVYCNCLASTGTANSWKITEMVWEPTVLWE